MLNYSLYIFSVMIFAVILGTGYLYLRTQKALVIAEALKSRCRKEQVLIQAGPDRAVLIRGNVRSKGVAGLTEYEILFIPVSGSGPFQIPLADIISAETEEEGELCIRKGDGEEVRIFVNDPVDWAEKIGFSRQL